MNRLIAILLLFSSFSIHAQELKKHIGFNITNDISIYQKYWRGGLQLTYTNERHFVSAGIKPMLPYRFEFGLYGYDINYRIYPHLPKKVVNPFFRVGIDFNYKNDSYKTVYVENPGNNQLNYSAIQRDVSTLCAYNAGYGFEVKVLSNLVLSTSMNIAYVINKHDERIIGQYDQSNVYTGSVEKENEISYTVLFGLGYNFAINEKR